ncbi:MAG: hypothetical protein ACR2NZ_19975 [Rubripirellula sp.]
MFETDALHRRGQALEDEFFHRVDEKLREQLRDSLEHEKQRAQLSAATGFEDEQLLDHLLEGGFQATTLAALALVPAVFIAWADGSVTSNERKAVLSAALNRGLDHEPTAMQMVQAWLDKHPPRSLWTLWKEYAEGLHDTVSETLSEMLMKEILRTATTVAEASGGTLGFGKISAAEQQILDDIANMYH